MLDDGHFAAIGRVAVACARLEFEQHLLTAALTGIDPSVQTVLASPGDSFSASQRLAREICTARFGRASRRKADPDPFPFHPHPLAVLLDAWMTSAKALVDKRNVFLHGLWGAGPDQRIGLMAMRPPHSSFAVSVVELHEVERQINELREQAQPLHVRVQAEVVARTRTVLAVLDESAEHASGSVSGDHYAP